MTCCLKILRYLCLARWFLLLWLTTATTLQAAGQSTTAIDSLKRALATATDTARVKVLYALMSELVGNNQPQAMAYAKQALAESKKLEWRWGQANGLEYMGRMYLRQGDYTQAQKLLLESLALWRELHNKRRAAQTASFIAELLAQTHQLAKALEWYNQALVDARAGHDTVALTGIYMGKGILHRQQHQPAAALPLFQQALVMTKRLRKGEHMEVLALNNLADTYIELDQPRAALPYLFTAIRLTRKANNKAGASFCEATLAQAYHKMGQVDMAIHHAFRAQQFASKTNNTPLLIGLNNLLDTLYAQQGDYRLARRYAAKSRTLEAQLRQEEQARKVAELQGRYDTREKERRIQLLRQQTRIAQLAALQQRTLRNAAVVTAGLLLLAVGVLVNRHRLRQRTLRQLDAQNQEKTLLLQEVHHRVKNNLQIVLSLLSNQLDALDARADPAVAASLRDSQSRVQTMALIHQNLYQSESLARVDMRRYLAELLEAIGGTFRHADVAVALDVAPVQLTPHTAVPLGLIVNELVTNAYKYAFAGRAHGNRLRVALRPAGAGALCLEVADNGPGLPALDLAVVQSLGLRLAAGLARQMQAQLTVRREGGTCFSLTFRELPGAGAEPAPAPGEAVSSVYMRV